MMTLEGVDCVDATGVTTGLGGVGAKTGTRCTEFTARWAEAKAGGKGTAVDSGVMRAFLFGGVFPGLGVRVRFVGDDCALE